MDEKELEKLKEEIKKEVEKALKEQHENEMSDLKKEIHTYKSQAGDYKKQLETLQNNGKSQEELLQGQLTEKETLISEKDKEITQLKTQIKIKELESKKESLIKEHNIGEQFKDFISITSEMTDEQLEALVKETKVKEEAFKADLLKDYSITEKGDITPKKEEDFVKKMAEKSKTNIPDDMWK